MQLQTGERGRPGQPKVLLVKDVVEKKSDFHLSATAYRLKLRQLWRKREVKWDMAGFGPGAKAKDLVRSDR